MQLASSMSHSREGTMLNSLWVQDSRDGIMQLPTCIINSAVIVIFTIKEGFTQNLPQTRRDTD